MSKQQLNEAVRILEFALNIRMYGENEHYTWQRFDGACESFLHYLDPCSCKPKSKTDPCGPCGGDPKKKAKKQ